MSGSGSETETEESFQRKRGKQEVIDLVSDDEEVHRPPVRRKVRVTEDEVDFVDMREVSEAFWTPSSLPGGTPMLAAAGGFPDESASSELKAAESDAAAIQAQEALIREPIEDLNDMDDVKPDRPFRDRHSTPKENYNAGIAAADDVVNFEQKLLSGRVAIEFREAGRDDIADAIPDLLEDEQELLENVAQAHVRVRDAQRIGASEEQVTAARKRLRRLQRDLQDVQESVLLVSEEYLDLKRKK